MRWKNAWSSTSSWRRNPETPRELLKSDLEIPSDIRGMLYEQIGDLKAEAIKIARFLKDAGYKLDASKLL